jgi:hypothetical protein
MHKGGGELHIGAQWSVTWWIWIFGFWYAFAIYGKQTLGLVGFFRIKYQKNLFLLSEKKKKKRITI